MNAGNELRDDVLYLCKMVANLAKYLVESDKAIGVLTKLKGVEITSSDFQQLLGEKLGYVSTESQYVASHDLTADQMVGLLQDASFIKPVIIGEVSFKDTIIPQGVPRSLNEQKVKSKGEIWYIHKYDADPFPSNPHAHNDATGYKVHLGTGELFDAKNNPVKQSIRKKDLLALRAQVSGVILPILAV